MCIISKEVKSVSKTQILVAVDSKKERQLVVYSNKIDNFIPGNAMILPVPNPSTVKFHNLYTYTDIFNDCNKMVYKKTDGFKGIRDGRITITNSRSHTLDVINVGSYKVSLANSLDDLKNIDKNLFNLGNGCEELLSRDYNDPNFGFIICSLDVRNKKYHPFGYSHQIMNNELFIPTKHYHEDGSYFPKKSYTKGFNDNSLSKYASYESAFNDISNNNSFNVDAFNSAFEISQFEDKDRKSVV